MEAGGNGSDHGREGQPGQPVQAGQSVEYAPGAKGARADRESDACRTCSLTGRKGKRDALIRFALSPDGILTPDLAARLPGPGAWAWPDPALFAEADWRKHWLRSFRRAFRQELDVPADLSERLDALFVERLIEGLGLARRAGLVVGGATRVSAALTAMRSVSPGLTRVSEASKAPDVTAAPVPGEAAGDRARVSLAELASNAAVPLAGDGAWRGVVLAASDASEDSARRIRGQAALAGLPAVDLLSAAELGRAFGAPERVFALVMSPGGRRAVSKRSGKKKTGSLVERLRRDSQRLAQLRGRILDQARSRKAPDAS